MRVANLPKWWRVALPLPRNSLGCGLCVQLWASKAFSALRYVTSTDTLCGLVIKSQSQPQTNKQVFPGAQIPTPELQVLSQSLQQATSANGQLQQSRNPPSAHRCFGCWVPLKMSTFSKSHPQHLRGEKEAAWRQKSNFTRDVSSMYIKALLHLNHHRASICNILHGILWSRQPQATVQYKSVWFRGIWETGRKLYESTHNQKPTKLEYNNPSWDYHLHTLKHAKDFTQLILLLHQCCPIAEVLLASKTNSFWKKKLTIHTLSPPCWAYKSQGAAVQVYYFLLGTAEMLMQMFFSTWRSMNRANELLACWLAPGKDKHYGVPRG